MNFKDSLKNIKELQTKTFAMLLTNIILAISLAYAVIQLSNKHDRVILVPPSMDKKAAIAWDAADKEYKKSFALYMATLVGNMQPKSSATILDSVSAFMDSRIYNSFREKILIIINDPVFKSSGSVISFIPQSIQYENETSRVFVTGTIVTTTSGSTKYSKNVVYELGIKIKEGRPWVFHFTSYEGNRPQTVNWWAQKSTKENIEIPAYALPAKWRKDIDLGSDVNFESMNIDDASDVNEDLSEPIGENSDNKGMEQEAENSNQEDKE